ncbi:1-acyl-sn-glycerol-3-phosphate acyltransferase [Reichenbachiella agarivorans]|uniref:1-acyl-sn-glycerol-3-phosphate acyltransferase n=1 Tax=Reichenbachiella agarivorans TaxID=2979464 RepID=A0ABY6CPV7_9BACT|nr:1-acyl-sn-glycerol-3-phosphate acyltransferase [Reichenbachiella agarivorans]UXP32553.1 1-acyl-sn-glycerol-3-phosphate acyltransferase [Reichenbachiella agarivorans]
MIYRLLREIVRIAIHAFYRDVVITKPFNIPHKGPLIIMSNHPNTLMDPLLLAILFKQKIGFLANASIFVNGIVSKVFEYFHVIPVYREQDISAGQSLNNEESFRACYDFLGHKNTLTIFPEGTSIHELKLRKIKTGGARIAFGTEQHHDFQLGTKILPVGLFYNNPTQFRSKVYVNFGEVISVADYQSQYQSDEIETVKTLTSDIRSSLEQLTLHTDHPEHETLFFQIKRIYKNQLKREFSSESDFKINQEIVAAINYFNLYHPDRYEELKEKINAVDEVFNELKAKDKGKQGVLRQVISQLGKAIYLLLGFPIFLYGVIHNFIPIQLPAYLSKKISSEKEYHASISLVLGILLFPICYLGWIWLAYMQLGLTWFQCILYLVSLPLSCMYALPYYRFAKRTWRYVRILLGKNKREQMAHLNQLSTDIRQELDNATQLYLNRTK